MTSWCRGWKRCKRGPGRSRRRRCLRHGTRSGGSESLGGRTSQRRSGGGNRRWGVAFDDKLPDSLPLQPDEDLDFISAGQPLRSRRFPFGEAETARLAVPGDGFIMDEFTFMVPEGCPLRAGSHLIVSEYGTHVGKGVLEERPGGKVVEVRAVGCKLELAEDRVGIRRHFTFKEDLDDGRDERRRSDGRGIGDGWRISKGGNEGDRRRKSDRGTQCDAGRHGDRGGGRKISIRYRLAVAV